MKIKRLVEAYDNGVLTKDIDFHFPEKKRRVICQDPPEQRDSLLYKENEEDKVYPYSDLPMIFHRVWKNINSEKLKELRQNNTWMDMEVWLCDGCFYTFAETHKPFVKEEVVARRPNDDDQSEGKSPGRSRGSHQGSPMTFNFNATASSKQQFPAIKLKSTNQELNSQEHQSVLTKKPAPTPAERMYENLVSRSIKIKRVS